MAGQPYIFSVVTTPTKKLIDIIRLLITKWVDLNAKLPDGRNVIHLLCRYYTHDNLIDLITILIENGVIADQYDDGWNALNFLSSYYGHGNLVDLVKLLIGKGFYTNAKSSYGWTALHLVCAHYKHVNLI